MGRGEMDLRDWFAGQALAALPQYSAIRIQNAYDDGQNTADVVADLAYAFADAMMEARSAGKPRNRDGEVG